MSRASIARNRAAALLESAAEQSSDWTIMAADMRTAADKNDEFRQYVQAHGNDQNSLNLLTEAIEAQNAVEAACQSLPTQ